MQKVYLATPYSHPDPAVRNARFERVTSAAAMLIGMGYVVMSPITHNHPIIMTGKTGNDWAYWGKFDSLHLAESEMMVVLRAPGWEVSVGVAAEMALAKSRGIPVWFLDEAVLDAWERSGCLPEVSEALLAA